MPRAPWEARIYLPAYTIAEAARYAGLKPQTVAAWHYRVGRRGTLLSTKERRTLLSYLQLVEVAVVAALRKRGLSLRAIRRAREYLARLYGSEFPFAQQRLLTAGPHLFVYLDSLLVSADRGGQQAWQEAFAERLREFDYDFGLAIRWHLAGADSRIVIDPRICFGVPTMRGVPTWAIQGRLMAGDSVASICRDFSLEEADVRDVLRFEGLERRAA